MATTADIRSGLILKIDGSLYSVIEFGQNKTARAAVSYTHLDVYKRQMLNGLLPCGLVYLALISAVAAGSFLNGATYMFAFGLGTLPAMMAVGFFKQWFSPAPRSRMRRLTPVLMAVAGIWLVGRGLLIQFPSLLPSSGAPTEIPLCHSGK